MPPGPRGLPIVGYVPFVRHESFHLQLAELAKSYGPIFSLRLGAKLSVVITSPAIAGEVLRSQDALFANRTPTVSSFTLSYGAQDMIWSAYGPVWRLLRRLTVREIMSQSRLDSFVPRRRVELRRMLHHVAERAGSPVDLEDESFITALNSIMAMLWGGTLEGEKREKVGSEFRRVIEEAIHLAGASNVSDFFPFLARFDLQGIYSESKKRLEWMNRILDDVVEERMKKDKEGEGAGNQPEVQDVLQMLLRFLKEEGEANNFHVSHLKSLFIVSDYNPLDYMQLFI